MTCGWSSQQFLLSLVLVGSTGSVVVAQHGGHAGGGHGSSHGGSHSSSHVGGGHASSHGGIHVGSSHSSISHSVGHVGTHSSSHSVGHSGVTLHAGTSHAGSRHSSLHVGTSGHGFVGAGHVSVGLTPRSRVTFAAPMHSGVSTHYGGDLHHVSVGGLHSSGFDSHRSFGVHQEPFHGIHHTHHNDHYGVHYSSHHDDHFYLGSHIGYSSYPRYAYASGGYGAYVAPVRYATPTVVVTQPVVTEADSTPVPVDRAAAPEGAPEIVPGEGAAPSRNEHSTSSGPVRLRAPLIETTEAPEVLPPLPGIRNPK